ncbi:MAG: radical SAM protein [Coriobacteriia bacterium]|nr:radical SAM protein [Coriobacteriia bacterium]
MTDVVLVNPPVSARERYGDLAEGGSRLPPIGLALLAAVVREAGYSVRVLDAEALGIDAAATALFVAESEPMLVGLTCVTMSAFSAGQVAAEVKSLLPDVTIALGGVHVTALPEETLRALPAVDLAALGEGEGTLRELVAALKNGSQLEAVAGLMLRGDGDEFVRTPVRAMLDDLDSLPMPAWDLLPDFPHRYRPAPNAFRALPSASLVTSRGCPGRCTFCDRSVSGRRVRAYSAQYLMRMVRVLHEEYGVRDIIFHDDNFVASRSRLLEFCDLMAEEAPGVSWWCTARVDLVTPEVLAAMKRAGCWQIAYGVESGSQEILDSLCKGITLDGIRQAIRWTREAGIGTRAYFMVGVPDDTPETLRASIDFLLELPLDDFHMTVYTPYAGTPLGDRVLSETPGGIDWRRCGDWELVYSPGGVTAAEVTGAQREAFRRFYARPRVIGRYLARMLRRPDSALVLLGGLRAWVRFALKRG